MSNDVTPLWPGYDKASDDELLDLLESKIKAARDPNNDAVDVRLVREFAQAIASHEWLKQNKLDGAGHNERLHARANEVRLSSWRP